MDDETSGTEDEPLCKEFFFSRVTIFKVLTGAPACAAASTALYPEAKSIDRDLARDTPSQLERVLAAARC